MYTYMYVYMLRTYMYVHIRICMCIYIHKLADICIHTVIPLVVPKCMDLRGRAVAKIRRMKHRKCHGISFTKHWQAQNIVKVWTSGGFQNHGPQHRPEIVGFLLQGHPHKGHPIYRNRHIVLIVTFKPALYQLQTLLKEPYVSI